MLPWPTVLASCLLAVPTAPSLTRTAWGRALSNSFAGFVLVSATEETGSGQSEFPHCQFDGADGGISVQPRRLRVRLGDSQHPASHFGHLDITVEKLLPGETPLARMNELRDRGCTASKAGAVMLEWQGYWVQLVSRCSMHEQFRAQFFSLLRALQKLDRTAPAPRELVWAPCGQMRLSTRSVAELRQHAIDE